MSKPKGGESQDGELQSFFKSMVALVKGRNELSDEEKIELAREQDLKQKLFDLQIQGGARRLQLLKERLEEALPGELRRLQRGISLQNGAEAQQRFMLAEQEKLSHAMGVSELHFKYGSLSPYVVAPEEMWVHYGKLKPGEVQAVYSYQLKRELFAFLERELARLDGDGSADFSEKLVYEGETSGPEKESKPVGRPAFSHARSFYDLFLNKGEAEKILEVLRQNRIISKDNKWLGTTGHRTEVATMARIIELKDYLKPSTAGERASAFNSFFNIELDSSAYRKEPPRNVAKFYRNIIPTRSK